MLTTYGAMIKNDVIEAFDKAVTNPENINYDINSRGIDWDFVNVDINKEIGGFYSTEYLNDCIGVLVDNYFDVAV